MAFALSGFGTRYFGTRWQPDGTYITTKWTVFFYVPLIPLGSVRVLEGALGGHNPFALGSSSAKVVVVPLDLGMVASTYAWEAGIVLFLFYGVPFLNELVAKL
jgi:hypothetical protein